MTTLPTILVYTHPGCPGGERALAFFQQRRIPVRVRDIAQNPEAWAEFAALGCIGTPVVLIGGEKFVGFDEKEISERLSDAADGRVSGQDG